MRKLTNEEYGKILKICDRASDMEISKSGIVTLITDVYSVAKNYDIDLNALYQAPDYDFAHDIRGIQAHINRFTGLLDDGFVPRCTR